MVMGPRLIGTRLLSNYRRLFHILSWLVVASYFGQAVLAGQFFSGSYRALGWHGTGGTVADVILFAAVVIGALLRWHAKGPIWPFWAALGLLVLNQAQNAAGAARLINLHIPLGVAMLGVAVAVALAASRPGRSILLPADSAPYATSAPVSSNKETV